MANGTPGNRGIIYECPQNWSSELLGPGRWARVGVIGEGSCFFHCICYCTNRDNYVTKNEQEQMDIAQTFRCVTFKEKFTEDVYNEFKKSVPNYGKTYTELRDDFCKPNVWADEVMIKFAAKTLGYNLLFLDLSSEDMYCNVHSKETLDAIVSDEPINMPTLLVSWVSRSHFEPIVKIVNCQEVRIRTMFNPAMSKEDYETVKYIMKRMNTECRLAKKKSS